jgi:AcrR family transcriptional regulator
LGEHILDIALEQFVERGAEGASMDAIAAAARVSKRTLYSRYGSKLGLLIEALKRSHDNRWKPIVAASASGSPRERLMQTARKMLDLSLKPDIIGLEDLVFWLRDQDIECFDAADLLVNPWTSMIHALLRKATGPDMGDSAEFDFLVSLIFDALVMIPRQRILVRKDMPDTSRAKTEYLEQTLDILAKIVPGLRKADVPADRPVRSRG